MIDRSNTLEPTRTLEGVAKKYSSDVRVLICAATLASVQQPHCLPLLLLEVEKAACQAT
jgi:hypothetical protein